MSAYREDPASIQFSLPLSFIITSFMKQLIILGLAIFCFSNSQAQTQKPTGDTLIVDAACGQCKLGLKGNSCDLAVRIRDTAYFVDGTSIDEHGDAHADDGFCNAIRKAAVRGEIINNRFRVSYFKLIPGR